MAKMINMDLNSELIEPTQSKKELMYKFYLLTYESNFELSKKRSLMTATMGYEKWAWRVVGITPKAIIEIAKNDYKLPKALQRDHLKQSRSQTFNAIFSNKKYEFEEWWKWVWENDETILMTKQEHIEHKNISTNDYFNIDYKLGYFRNKAVIGMHYTKKTEGMYVKDLFEKNKLKIEEIK